MVDPVTLQDSRVGFAISGLESFRPLLVAVALAGDGDVPPPALGPSLYASTSGFTPLVRTREVGELFERTAEGPSRIADSEPLSASGS